MQSFKMRLNRFVRSRCTLDFRFDTLEERRMRCERFAAKNKTCGKRAVFIVSED